MRISSGVPRVIAPGLKLSTKIDADIREWANTVNVCERCSKNRKGLRIYESEDEFTVLCMKCAFPEEIQTIKKPAPLPRKPRPKMTDEEKRQKAIERYLKKEEERARPFARVRKNPLTSHLPMGQTVQESWQSAYNVSEVKTLFAYNTSAQTATRYLIIYGVTKHYTKKVLQDPDKAYDRFHEDAHDWRIGLANVHWLELGKLHVPSNQIELNLAGSRFFDAYPDLTWRPSMTNTYFDVEAWRKKNK